MLTIAVPITVSAEMNTKNPSAGAWSFHHVLPVRVYYLIAATILRIITMPGCDAFARRTGSDILKAMSQYAGNRTRITVFTDADWRFLTPTDSQIAEVAKLCGSPEFGGFGGPQPDQRRDNSNENEELNRPQSASQIWWDALKTVRQLIYLAFNLHSAPGIKTVVIATKTPEDWQQLMYKLCKHLWIACAIGQPNFENADWACADNRAWTVLRNRDIPDNSPLRKNSTVGPQMKLRLASEHSTFFSQYSDAISIVLFRKEKRYHWTKP